MRHLRSILYALVLAPAVWILCGVGFDQDLTGRARDNGGVESLTGVLLLLLAGTAYAILLFSPISPAGPLVAGLVFLGVGAWARLAPDAYAGIWPAGVAKEGFDLSTPGYGLAVLLAVPFICTALSAKRWAAYEPPQILLIGTLGRARGAAPVAGPRMAAEQTTVIPPAASVPPAASGDATQVIGQTGPAPRAVSPSGVSGSPGDDGDEKTTVLRLGSSASADTSEPTTVMALGKPAASQDEPTTAVALGKPAASQDEQITVMALGKAAEGRRPEAAAEKRRPDAADEPTGPMGLEDKPTESIAAEQPSEAGSPEDETTRDVAASEEATRDVAASEEVTRDTSAAREVSAAEAPTRDVTGAEATRDAKTTDLSDPGPGGGDEAMQAASPEPAADEGDEKTQVLRLPTPDEVTRYLGGEATTRPLSPPPYPLGHGEETQVIGVMPQAEPGERTQVIRTGTVEPPGDRTQVLSFTAAGETATVTTKPGETTKPMSIVGEERPNPGEDPTTRLVPTAETTPPPADPGEATTQRRAMTVSNLERPADEAEDDTRPLNPAG